VKLVAVVGDDFAHEDSALLASRRWTWRVSIAFRRPHLLLAGRLFLRHERCATLRTDLNVFAGFNPKLPETYCPEPYLFLGNIQPSLQKACGADARLKLTGGDTMNYWIEDFRAELLETIREWDFLLINDSEARLLFGRAEPAARGGPAFWKWARTRW